MKNGFYKTLALNNIKKNYRFFVPRMLSEAGLLACFYISLTLAGDGRLSEIKGGAYIPTFMWMAVAILGTLSAILMFYTNSFLMKQRKREFGIYNVLGMEKRHIGKVLFHETFICSVISVIGGLALGVLFYKLCSLLICKLLEASIILGFYFITPVTLIPAGLFFILLDLITYVINIVNVGKMKPVELIQSKHAGEKEPKVKWLMLVLGVLTLGGGYYISLTTQSPLAALGLFFLAVMLVIVGTYFLFITGSTFVLKSLKKNQKYYYNKNHMPAVSGLLYRMKQNAVGLASIAILGVGVLVMVSTSVSLYSGIDGTLKKNYPQDLYFNASYTTNDGKEKNVTLETLDAWVKEAADKNGVDIEKIEHNKYLNVGYYMKDNVFLAETEVEEVDYSIIGSVGDFIFITEQTYEELTGDKLNLTGREVVTCRISSDVGDTYDLKDDFSIAGNEYTVKDCVYYFPIQVPILARGFKQYGIVVANDEILDEIYESQLASYGEDASQMTYRIAVKFADKSKVYQVGEAIGEDIRTILEDSIDSYPDASGSYMYNLDSFWNSRESMIGMFGSLLFLGILLGAVCMFAAVLIIYYKQISEGYEDRERFQIMEKIGMSKKEVKKTINTQVLLVFFLPLITAGIHFIFAYPMLQKMLRILMLYNPNLFMICSIISFAIFSLLYILIYKGTSRTYYKIVN